MGQQTIVDKTGLAHKRPLSVLLIEDSPLIRRSLVEAIDASGELQVTAWADTPETAIGAAGSGEIRRGDCRSATEAAAPASRCWHICNAPE